MADTSAEPTDTVAQRRHAELERCKFVYHDEQGLRECLVLKNGWAPADAARAIAVYRAAIARRIDSLRGIRDSLTAAQLAKHRQEAAYAAGQPYWGAIRTRTYYTNTPNCEALRGLAFGGLRFFKTTGEAEKAGYARADQPGC